MPESTSIKIFIYESYSRKWFHDNRMGSRRWKKCFGKKFYGRNKSLFPNEKGNKPQYPSQFTGNFFKKRWERVYFYGAGCANLDKKTFSKPR